MKTYILGYASPCDNELTEFKNVAEADFNSEEWVKVDAESLEEAKSKYETSFLAWQKNQ